MTAIKLTDAAARAAMPPETGLRVIWDNEVKGLGLRITARGAKSFILNYRVDRIQRQLTIGSFPDWSVKAARDHAKALKRRIDEGEDPMGDRHALREAPTVQDLADHYCETHLPKKRPSSRRTDELTLRLHILPRLGRMKVAAVRHTDIANLHREISRETPPTANRMVALLSKMMNLAVKAEWRADNPCKGIEMNQEERRERYLTPAEITRLLAALAGHPEQLSAKAIMLLLLTGARRGEVLSAHWDQIDLVAGVWTKAAASTKQKRIHRVPLSAPALQLLRDLKADQEAIVAEAKQQGQIQAASKVCFPGRAGRPLTEIKKLWASVCRQAQINNARIHDLRHTYASILASSGLSLPIIGQLLGHTSPLTTHRYAHLMDDPLRAATERVGAIIHGGERQSVPQVVPISAAQRSK